VRPPAVRWIPGGGKTPLCDVATDRRNRGRGLFASSGNCPRVTTVAACASIRGCYYRPDEHLPTETWPAMIACVTDLDGRITGVHRTWLDPDGVRPDSARQGSDRHAATSHGRPARPRGTFPARRMTTCLLPAKASETMLSPALYRSDLVDGSRTFRQSPGGPWCFSSSLRRLYIARDAGCRWRPLCKRPLTQRAGAVGIEAIALSPPRLGDFNEDPARSSVSRPYAQRLRIQLAPEDVDRFLLPATALG